MNEIISQMMDRIKLEETLRDNYYDLVTSLGAREGESTDWAHANLMYHRSCAALRAMKDMFQVVTGIPYDKAMESLGKGA